MWIAETVELDDPVERKLRVSYKRHRTRALVPQQARVILLAAERQLNKHFGQQPSDYKAVGTSGCAYLV